MLCPDDLPAHYTSRPDITVTHSYPDEWDEAEVDEHRYDACPCSPEMRQNLSHHRGYHWIVEHRRIPRTEEQHRGE